MKKNILTLLLICFTAAAVSAQVAVKIKNLTQVEGIRENQLQGYGIIVGLEGTGDSNKSFFTITSIVNMLKNYGLNLDPSSIKIDNAAAVMVTMNLKPFTREGQKADVIVSSIGDAETLQGGELLQTPLFGADGKVYAVAQGRVSIGGFNASSGGSKVQKNHPTSGRVPGGAIIEQNVSMDFIKEGSIRLLLNNSDFLTASKISETINLWNNEKIAETLDAGAVKVNIPEKFKNDPALLIAKIGEMSIVPEQKAKVILNTRTGTIVIGDGVKLKQAAIAHGSLNVVISENVSVSQPGPLSGGETVEVSEPSISVTETGGKVMLLKEGSTLRDVVNALNSIGASPRDIISIIQALKESGSLFAELELI